MFKCFSLLEVAMVAISVALLACGKKAEGIAQTTNSDVKVEKLFSVDGCTVYRFEDWGRYHYFSNCDGSISHTVNCGKNCRYEESIKTSRGECP